jgi:hypothetical protein
MKLKATNHILGWVVVVSIILGIFIYFFSSSNSEVTFDPNVITVIEGTRGFKNNLNIGVANIQNDSGIVHISSETDIVSQEVKTGDDFDFQNYHIQIIKVKENTKILPIGWTGGSNGSIVLEITEK